MDATNDKSEPLLEPPRNLYTPTPKSSATQSAVALIKAVVGTGVFALPPAMRASGWLLGSGMVLVMSAVSLFTVRAIILSIQELRKRGVAAHCDGRIEFQELTTAAYPSASCTITTLSVIVQAGSIISFFVFVSDNIAPLTRGFLSDSQIILVMALIVAPLALLRNTSHPAFAAAMAFGNACVAVALVTVMAAGASELRPGSFAAMKAVDFDGAGLMFGISLFMFSCQLECVSIEQDMARREQFTPMIVAAFAVLTIVFLVFGIFVYACFGESTGLEFEHGGKGIAGKWISATVLQNLGGSLLGGGSLVATVQVAVAANLTFMCPITLLPASKALEASAGVHSTAARWALRLTLVGVLALLAVVLPDFELITGLIGAVSSFICFVMPALCYLRFCAHELNSWQRLGARAVVAFGWAGAAFSLAQQLWPAAKTMVVDLESPH